MKIIFQKNKKLAFENFYNQLKFQRIYPSPLDSFDIPEQLVKQAERLRDLKIKKFNNTQKESYKKIVAKHNELWNWYSKDLNTVARLLKIQTQLRQWLKTQIPGQTKINWPYNEVFIFPAIRNWASQNGNKIALGIRPNHLLKELDISLIIHELIHVNTESILTKKLKFSRDSNEITATLLTRKITKKINQKFRMKVFPQEFAVPFRHLEKYNEQLKHLADNVNSYKDLVVKVDDFLTKINHQTHYTI